LSLPGGADAIAAAQPVGADEPTVLRPISSDELDCRHAAAADPVSVFPASLRLVHHLLSYGYCSSDSRLSRRGQTTFALSLNALFQRSASRTMNG
jgi:hypothetical protein